MTEKAGEQGARKGENLGFLLQKGVLEQLNLFRVTEFTVSISAPLNGTAVELRSRWRSLRREVWGSLPSKNFSLPLYPLFLTHESGVY